MDQALTKTSSSDIMDWRAKSQSRSRSRPPDYMDWRAQSRSRSRAPDFRVRAPSLSNVEVNTASATANLSRFFGDSGVPASIAESPPAPAESQTDDLFAAFLHSFDNSTKPAPQEERDLTSTSLQSSGLSGLTEARGHTEPEGMLDNQPNLAEIESTLNQLINMQSSSGSNSNTTSPQRTSPLSQSVSSTDDKPSLAQQHLKHLMGNVSSQACSAK